MVYPLPMKMGQKTKAESMPVVLPSDYAISITGVATEVTAAAILVDTGNIEVDTTAIALDTADIAVDTGNIATSVSNMDTSLNNIETDVDNIAADIAILKARLTGSLVPTAFDSIYPTFNATEDVYVYKLATVTVKTLTVTYTDATKAVITSIVAV